MTPLHWAVQNCHVEVIEILLKNFAQTDVVNKFGLTPADIALQLQRLDLLELLNIPNRVQHMTLQWEENDEKMTVVDQPESISNSPIPLGRFQILQIELKQNHLNNNLKLVLCIDVDAAKGHGAWSVQ